MVSVVVVVVVYTVIRKVTIVFLNYQTSSLTFPLWSQRMQPTWDANIVCVL